MNTIQELFHLCTKNEKKPYSCIKYLKNRYDCKSFILDIYRIQGSMGAHPASHAAAQIPIENLHLHNDWLADIYSKRGLFDILLRFYCQAIETNVTQNRGQDGSGSILSIKPGQQILERNTISLIKDFLEVRFTISFAGKKSLFLGNETKDLVSDLEHAVNSFISKVNSEKEEIQSYVEISKNHNAIQQELKKNNWTTFIGNDSKLARVSGTDDRPLSTEKGAISFHSPASLQRKIHLPDGSSVTGMIIPEGITLITGGGFHGKSTLLQAITKGIYPHIPGDGREFVVTRNDALPIRAEEGRSVRSIDISPFISNLPTGIDTRFFSTDRASGSTSQAAAIRESIDAGSQLLLFDEDRTAVNFMIIDKRMRELVGKENEPINPLVNTIRPIYKKQGVSFILVVGGIGEFLDRADCVISMKSYMPNDVTKEAKILCQNEVIDDEGVSEWLSSPPRYLAVSNLNPVYINKRLAKTIPTRIKPDRLSPWRLEYGEDILDLHHMEQLVDSGQTMTIGLVFYAMRKHLEKAKQHIGVNELVNLVFEDIEKEGLDILPTLNKVRNGFSVSIRPLDVLSAINRLRSLKILNEI